MQIWTVTAGPKVLAITPHHLPEEAFNIYLWEDGWVDKYNYLLFSSSGVFFLFQTKGENTDLFSLWITRAAPSCLKPSTFVYTILGKYFLNQIFATLRVGTYLNTAR